jgi:phosphoribosylglycinamide formyltransferase-1
MHKKLNAKIAVVISGDSDAYGIERAKQHNIPSIILEKKQKLEHILKGDFKVDYIVLAGWKKIIPESLMKQFPNKILNLHPGLIPDTLGGEVKNPDGSIGLWNRGKLTNDAVQNFLTNGATYAGSTVHVLSNLFDFGEVIARCFEKIKKNDTVDTLYARLKKKENKMYVDSLVRLSQFIS